MALALLLGSVQVLAGERYRYQYHEESTKVSIVSVSRVAGPPQPGHSGFEIRGRA